MLQEVWLLYHPKLTFPSNEDKLAAEEQRSASASSIMKSLLLQDGEEREGRDRDCSWRLFNDLINFLTEKNLGLEGGVEKTSGRQFVNTLSDVPASLNRGGCCHGHALRGPGPVWRAPHVFFLVAFVFFFFFSRARVAFGPFH